MSQAIRRKTWLKIIFLHPCTQFSTVLLHKDADRALKALNDTVFDGKEIRVDYSISRGPHAKTPGQYLGEKR